VASILGRRHEVCVFDHRAKRQPLFEIEPVDPIQEAPFQAEEKTGGALI